MSIMIREYLGFDKFDAEIGYKDVNHLKENYDSTDPISPNSLMVDIEGIHVGPTRNYTRYTEQALKSSVRSWTHPYRKPLIMHHNEKDGKIIGRINSVFYTDKKTRSGTGALVFTTNVPDRDGMEQIEDGRLMTVSIGIIGHDVRCSICEHNIAEYGPCEHERGQVYDGEICYWDIYEMEGKELSYVIVPSDIYAKNIRIYKPITKKTEINENLEERVFELKLTESEVQKLQADYQTLQENNQQLENDKASLSSKLQEAETKLKDAETKLQEVQEKLKEAQDKVKELESESATLKEEKETLTKDLEDTKSSLIAKESELAEEKSLRESLESQSVELNEANKQVLVENYVLLRKLAGKPDVELQSIQERTKESLSDAIKDLKEELGNGGNITAIKPVIDPTITGSLEGNVKKEKKASNIDLEEGLQNLFYDIANKYN